VTFITSILTNGYSSQSLALGTADSEGRFELKNVPTQDVEFQVHGTGIESTEIDLSEWSGDSLEVVVPLELRFQLEPNAARGAEYFKVFNANGERLRLVSLTSGVTSHLTQFHFRDREVLPTFRVSDSATDLVFYSGDQEVRRIALDLRRGEIARLR